MNPSDPLASIGYVLFPFFRRLYIASTHTFGDNYRPYSGSHPAVDSLWSTETLEFIHDGCEATRVDKTALIAQSDLALKSLRVCGKNTEGVSIKAELTPGSKRYDIFFRRNDICLSKKPRHSYL